MHPSPFQVLVVDDLPQRAAGAVAHLRGLGHAVEICTRAEDGVARARGRRAAGQGFDLVLAQLHLTGRDGLWLVGQLEHPADARVALYTSFGSLPAAIFNEAEARGCLMFLDEPLEPKRIDMLLRRLAATMRQPKAARSDDPFSDVLAHPRSPAPSTQPGSDGAQRSAQQTQGATAITSTRIRRGVTGNVPKPEQPATLAAAKASIRCLTCHQEFMVALKATAFAMVCIRCGAPIRVAAASDAHPALAAATTAPAVRSAQTSSVPTAAPSDDARTTSLLPSAQQFDAEDGAAGVPTEIAGYRILSVLGHGGMATVYRAVQVSMQRDVALKVIAPRFAIDPAFSQRFIREARVAGSISHPNVITCYDVGRDQGRLYMALELLSGGDAAQLASARGGRLDEASALRVILDGARGLGALAAAGLIHRDIKPANLFITSSGGAKLADLGLARATDAHEHTSMGVAIGTPAFMPPEQASGDIALDVRADIYSLGATLYALLTGRAPYVAPTLWAVIAKVLSPEEPADPRELGARVSERTCVLLRRMMAKDREQRPANIAEVVVEIESLLAVMPAWSRTTMVLPVDVPRSGGDETIVGMDLRG